MIRGLRDVLSFLSIIPAGGRSISKIAAAMYLFPVAGLIVGTVAGAVSYAASWYMEPLAIGVVAATSLAVITGMHHIDGLADFADGLMAGGSTKRRREAMRDKMTGAAGVTAILLCMASTVVFVSQAGAALLYVMVWCEMLSKYSMVLVAYTGGGTGDGSGHTFCELADGKNICLASIIMVAAGVGGWLLGMPVHQMIVSAIAVGVVAGIMVLLSKRRFGGITGDVLGATNEICRAAALGAAVSV